MAKSPPKRELSKATLEKEKLKAELNSLNRNQYLQPAFLTPLITLLAALVVYGWLWKSGIFDYRQAHLAYVTDTLQVYKQRLDANIGSLNDSAKKLNDSIQTLFSRLSLFAKEEALAKQKYAVHLKENLTKKELIEKTQTLVNNIMALLNKYNRKSDSINYASVAAMIRIPQEQRTTKMDSVWRFYSYLIAANYQEEMEGYNTLYRSEAIYLRNEMEKYLPKDYQGKINVLKYTNAPNSLIVEENVEDLEVSLKRIKATVE